MDDRLYQALKRIADVLEREHLQNAEWIALQTKWHGEDNTGERLIAIHEEQSERERKWVEEQRRLLIDFLAKEHDAYVEVAREEVRKKLDTEALVPVFLPGTSQQTTPTRERGE